MENAEAGEAKKILAQLARIELKVDRLMTFAEDVEVEMGKMNTATTEIAADIADLVSQLAATPSAAEKAAILAKLAAHNATLTAIGSAHTPVPVVPTEPVPGSEPLPV